MQSAFRVLILFALFSASVIPHANGQSRSSAQEYERLFSLARAKQCSEVIARGGLLIDKLQGEGAGDTQLFALHLDVMGHCYFVNGQYAQAEPVLRKSFELMQRFVRPEDEEMGRIHKNIAVLYARLNRPADALLHIKAIVSPHEFAYGLHPDRGTGTKLANALNTVMHLYRRELRSSADAEAVAKRALEIMEGNYGPRHPNTAFELMQLATFQLDQAHYDQADRNYTRAIDILEQASKERDKTISSTARGLLGSALANFAVLLFDVGRSEEMEGLLKRALDIQIATLGPDHFDVGHVRILLGELYKQTRRFVEAEAQLKMARASNAKAFDPMREGNCLAYLAGVYYETGRLEEAETSIKRAIVLFDQEWGGGVAEDTGPRRFLGDIYRKKGRFDEAEELYRRVLTVRQKQHGNSHPEVANIFNDLANLYMDTRRTDQALASVRESARIVVNELNASFGSSAGVEMEKRRSHLDLALQVLHRAMQEKLVGKEEAGEDAFAFAQWATRSSAALALAQMAGRVSAGDDALAKLARSYQDAASERKALEKQITSERGSATEATTVYLERAKTQLATVNLSMEELGRRLSREFPSYASFANPLPLPIAQVQKLLASDEALIFFLTAEKQGYVFAITRTAFDWHEFSLRHADLTEKIASLRRAVDVEDYGRIKEQELFDLGEANALYVELFSKIEPIIKDKKHLVLVPSGALTSLPFQLLVTEKPLVAKPRLNEIGAYRDAAWLIKRHALSVLPGVSSLKVLRDATNRDKASKPLIGFADPDFKPEQSGTKSQTVDAQSRSSTRTRAFSHYWRGTRPDLDALRSGLASLPETAVELRKVARQLGASESDLRIGEAASEAVVKQLDLMPYRVVYFATHGLVAGELKGLAEPALALTIPREPSDVDDGLLTASEIAQLKLNADWVVLSACNTAAGDKPGAEALSGLARAFFYAGARALLVSHWRVDSEAAVRLTTGTFEVLKKDPSLGRAEAVRKSMLAYMNDVSNPWNAYPDFWGPFSVVGEGGRGR